MYLFTKYYEFRIMIFTLYQPTVHAALTLFRCDLEFFLLIAFYLHAFGFPRNVGLRIT